MKSSLIDIWDSLGVSKWTAIKTLLFGGWSDLAIVICNAFTNLLRKADPKDLKMYAEVSEKIAKVIRLVIELFVSSVSVRDAASHTCDTLIAFSDHIKDGMYTPDELDADIDAIEECIDNWKKVIEKAGK